MVFHALHGGRCVGESSSSCNFADAGRVTLVTSVTNTEPRLFVGQIALLNSQARTLEPCVF